MIIKGENVTLKSITIDDTPDIVRWRNNIRNYFLQRALFTEESHNNWLQNVVEKGKAKQFVIETKEHGRIGSVFLKNLDYENKKAEYGIFIGEENALGKGYGSECARLMIDYGFSQLKLHKIMLRVIASNKRAIQSYKKAGFSEEGYLKDEVLLDGEYTDLVLMGIINQESDN